MSIIIKIPLDKVLACCLFFLLIFSAKAQTDTRFWFAAPDVTTGHGDDPIRMVVSSFDDPAVVTITQPANLGFPTYIVAVPANTSQIIDLTGDKALVETPFDTPTPAAPAVFSTGILVESTAKITAYYEVNRDNNPDIFALKGNNALGTDFYVPFQNSWNHNTGLTPNGRTGFIVVATENNTTITVTPTRNLEGGQAAGVPFNVVLNAGETYMGSVVHPTAGNFPSGTRIQSDRPVAVTKFSDSMYSGQGGCYDLFGDQLVPVDVIGTDYIVLRGRLGIDSGTPAENPELIVVTATQDGTEVRVNGVLMTTLNTAQTYTHTLPTAGQRVFVNTTQPAYVGHYAGYGCEGGFAILPPVECTGSVTTRIVRSDGGDFTINLMTRGTPVGGTFDFTNNFTVRVNGTVLYSPTTTPFPVTFTQVGGSNYYGTQYSFNTTEVPVGAVVTIENTTLSPTDPAGLFHLGFVNGGAGSGTRYGYFSGFRALDLGGDVNINYGTDATITADIEATNYRWLSDGVEVQNGTSDTYTVTDIQRRQTIRVEATIGDCVVSDEICVGTLEYVWDGSFPGGISNDDNWSKPCGLAGIPDCSIDVIIPPPPIASSALNIDAGEVLSVRNLTILGDGISNGQLNVAATGRVDVCGDMIHDGDLNMQPNSTFRFIGTERQDYSKATSGTGDFENLIIANTGTPSFENIPGVTILSSSDQDLNVSATGSLTFQQGYIVPEDYSTNQCLVVDNSRSVIVKNPATNAIAGFNNTPSSTTSATDYFVAGNLIRSTNSTGYYPMPVGIVLQEPSVIIPEPTKNGNMPGFEDSDWQTAVYGGNACNPNPNGVLTFTADDEFVNFGANTANMSVGGGNVRTVEIWANVTSFNGAGLFQFGDHDSNGDGAGSSSSGDFALVTGTTNNTWFIRLDNGFDLELINLPNSLNNWHHYALTYNGDPADPQVTFYYDGILIRNYSLPTPLATVLDFGQIGRWSGSNTLSMRGQVDELKIWTERRTTEQIRQSFEQGCAANALQCPQATNLLSYYNFEDGQLNGATTRTVSSRTIQCPVPTFSYQRADINFPSPTAASAISASFQQHNNLPPATGQTGICNGDFDVDPFLNNGYWNLTALNNSGTSINAGINNQIALWNKDYSNFVGASTTVAALDENQDPCPAGAPWTIPDGYCVTSNPDFTFRGGFTGNMGYYSTAQSQDIVILPVEWLYVKATPKRSTILVEWGAIEGENNYGYEVYKATKDNNFVKIGFVQPKGQAKSRQDYQFVDVEVSFDTDYYYKIKQIDADGSSSYTKVVTAKLTTNGEEESAGTVKIYPNPVENILTIDLSGSDFISNQQVEIEVINAIGATLLHRTINVKNNAGQFTLQMDTYSKGVYFLRIKGDTNVEMIKVSKR